MSDLKGWLELWPVLSTRVDEGLAIAPGAREEWLGSLPHDDAFKAALRELLAQDGALALDGSIGELPTFELAGDDESSFGLGVGTRVGPYRLERELGRGGMGLVWLAERADGTLKRKVALKLPRLDASERLHDRMQRERDILASLDHPHIARIYDAGIDAHGRPYLALEHVEGEPIDRYCRERKLTTHERLQLLLQVARAVAHAHGKLVVHRDLKPANILVTATGEARLLDFGIAQLMQGELVHESALTRQVGRVLTLDYASPEQLRGESLGTASDVYSLAVVAYELLTDEKPYRLKRDSAAALEEAIVSVDVRPASAAASDPAVRKALRGDIDAILNKAMKPSAAERYASVEAFARDIERHLQQLPVEARPDAPWYRLRRFVGRNAIAVSAASAVALALVIGSAVALWQARTARSEAERAEQVKNFALSIVNGADAGSSADKATTAVELLQAARVRVDQELSANPATAVELLTAVGTGLQSQGRAAEAVALLDETRRRAEKSLGDTHPLTLQATIAYGLSLVTADRPKDAIAVLEPAASAAARQHNGHATIEALFDLSTAQLLAAEGDAGLASARAAVAALENEGTNARPVDAFNAWAQLANALNATQQPGLADAAGRASQFAQQIYGDKPTGNALAVRLLRARGLSAEGRDSEALAQLETLYADALRVFGPDQLSLEPIANFLGIARFDAGDLDGAATAFRAALEVNEHVQGGTGGNRGIEHYALGRTFAAQRRDDEALEHLQASVRLLTQSVGATRPQTLRSRSLEASVLTRQGRLADADREFAEIAAVPWPGAERALNDSRLALLRDSQSRHDEAVALARASADVLQANTSKNIRAMASAALGHVLLGAGRPDDAVAPLEQAIALWSATQSRATPDRAAADADLARARGAAQR